MSKLKAGKSGLHKAESRSIRMPVKTANAFYLSPEWRALMGRIVSARGRRCQDPECRSPDCSQRRIFGDHIRELRDGGAPLDERNVLLRCGSCHTRKTLEARATRYRAAT